MKKIMIYFFLFFACAGCEKRTDWLLVEGLQKNIVVDAIITDNKSQQTITLTFPVANLNENPEPVTGAIVVVSDENSPYQFKEDSLHPGIYTANFVGVVGRHYTLMINYNNSIYSAKAVMPVAYIAPQFGYSKNDDDELYHMDILPSPYNAKKYAMWEVNLDWHKVAGYQGMNPDSCRARLLYYTLPTIDVSEMLSPEMQEISFPAGTVVNQKRYSLTPEHAEYLRALLLETSWQGGIFDLTRSSLPTNISNDAYGFFGACSVTSLSFSIVQK